MRRPVQITATILYNEDEEGRQVGYEHNIFVVADDGSMWFLSDLADEWTKLPDLPAEQS